MRGRVALLCRSLGYSKQAYYRGQRAGSRQERDCYLAGLVVKATPWNNNNLIPIVCGVVGLILGLVCYLWLWPRQTQEPMDKGRNYTVGTSNTEP